MKVKTMPQPMTIALLILSILTGTLVLNFGYSQTATAVTAEKYCKDQYPTTSKGVLGMKEAAALRAACQLGFNTGKCGTISGIAGVSKERLKSACKVGADKKAEEDKKKNKDKDKDKDKDNGKNKTIKVCNLKTKQTVTIKEKNFDKNKHSKDLDMCKEALKPGKCTSILPGDFCESGSTVQDNGIWKLLLLTLQILTAGVAIVAVGGIIYGAILYATAGDNSSQVEKAVKTIINVVVGVIMFAALFALSQWLIPGGVFNTDEASKSPESSERPPGEGGEDESGEDEGDEDEGGGDEDEGSPGAPDDSDENDSKDGNKPKDIASKIKMPNFRDVSASTNGKVLKPGMLYRSPALGSAKDVTVRRLGKLLGKDGLIIDLRTASTASAKPDKNIPGVSNVNIPIGGITDTTPMVTDPTRREQLKKVLKMVANAKGPVLIHCAAGKDRTGWAVAMIMYAAGAKDSQVMTEYMKTNDVPKGKKPIDGGVKKAWLQKGINAAKKEYGSIKNYLKKGVGLSDQDLKNIKNKFGA